MKTIRRIMGINLISKLNWIKNMIYITEPTNNYHEFVHKRRFNGVVTMILLLIAVLSRINPQISKLVALIFISYTISEHLFSNGYYKTLKVVENKIFGVTVSIIKFIKNIIQRQKTTVANVGIRISKNSQI